MTDEDRLTRLERPLLARWAALLPGQPGLGRSLIERYAEPARHYHHLGHLVDVLESVDAIESFGGERADDGFAVRLSVWFHDAVYNVRATDNEEQSARLAVDELEAIGLEFDLVEEVARLVRLTTTHAAEAGDRNGQVLCDADLAILASPPSRFAEYARQIRAEYAHVSDVDFRAGRSAVLQQLLALPSLYGTELGKTRWEAAARSNLRAELDAL